MPDPATRAAQTKGDEGVLSPETPATPPPEPWTPSRVLDWNRYYDYYLVAAMLLLVFIASAHPIVNASLWSDLQSGRLISEQGPVTTDPFSYTMKGKPWVNISWVYQTISARIWALAESFRPDNTEALGATILVTLACVIRVLTALVLLKIRRAGPALWWSVLCVALALGVVLRPMPRAPAPLVPVLGGIAGWGEVTSSTWGILFLAIELLLLFRASSRGCRRTLLVLVPLFLLWANVDESFLFGLITLGFWALGSLLPQFGRGKAEIACGRVTPLWAFGTLLACGLVCLFNPSFQAVYPAAARPYIDFFRPATDVITRDQLSYFKKSSQDLIDVIHGGADTDAYRYYIAYYLLVVGAAAVSFVLNWRRFSLSRLLVFLWAAALWAALEAMSAEFAIVWAAVLALNGQEWYHDAFGVEGRTEAGWRVWSVGGRFVTLLLISLMIVKGLTGYAATPAEPNFGFGVNVDDFAFEAADYLAKAPIEGNVLNLTLANGDALIWRAWPVNRDRLTFIDGRDRLFPTRLRDELETIKKALLDNEKAVWSPLLDERDISLVMLPTGSDPSALGIHDSMRASGDWIPFYDDGSVVLMGRADSREPDLAYFQENRLVADRLAFRTLRDVPSSDAIPSPSVRWYDQIFQNRFSKSVQPHALAADRWLKAGPGGAAATPDAAHSLLAVGEARTALSRDPNDDGAWVMLNNAYSALTSQEGQILANASVADVPDAYVQFRFRQRAMALSYAIEATPPPRTPEDRNTLQQLHFQLANLYQSRGFFDLALEQFQKLRDLVGPADFPVEMEALTAQLEQSMQSLRDRIEQSVIDQQTSPMERADFAMAQGAPGLALQQLEEAESYGMSLATVKSRLMDLYCEIGRPDRAIELFSAGDVEDPALSTGPGTASYRQGLVYFLIGSYDVATSLWRDRAIPQLRASQTMQALEAGRLLLQGNLSGPNTGGVVDSFLDLPSQITRQASWEYQLGLCLLESGQPEQAAEAFIRSLEIDPETSLRPLLAYYLEQIGKPVPPAPESATAPAEAPALPATLPTDLFAPVGSPP